MSFEKETIYKFSTKGTNCRLGIEVRALGTTITLEHLGSKKALYFNYGSDFDQSAMVALIEGTLKASESLSDFIFRLLVKSNTPNFYCFKLEA